MWRMTWLTRGRCPLLLWQLGCRGGIRAHRDSWLPLSGPADEVGAPPVLAAHFVHRKPTDMQIADGLRLPDPTGSVARRDAFHSEPGGLIGADLPADARTRRTATCCGRSRTLESARRPARATSTTSGCCRSVNCFSVLVGGSSQSSRGVALPRRHRAGVPVVLAARRRDRQRRPGVRLRHRDARARRALPRARRARRRVRRPRQPGRTGTSSGTDARPTPAPRCTAGRSSPTTTGPTCSRTATASSATTRCSEAPPTTGRAPGRVTVARVPAGRVFDRPTYWTGSTWSSSTASRAVSVIASEGRLTKPTQFMPQERPVARDHQDRRLVRHRHRDRIGRAPRRPVRRDRATHAPRRSATAPTCNTYFSSWIEGQNLGRPDRRADRIAVPQPVGRRTLVRCIDRRIQVVFPPLDEPTAAMRCGLGHCR